MEPDPVLPHGDSSNTLHFTDTTSYLSTTSKVIYLGFCFCFIFTSSSIQTFVTTLYPSTGFFSLALLQIVFALASFFAGFLVHSIGPKWNMIIGGWTYVLYVVVMQSNNSVLLLITSALNGLGAALLWVSQGLWLTNICSSKPQLLGSLTGIFFTLFNLGNVLGNGLIFLLLEVFKWPLNTIIWFMTGLCSFGALLLFFSASIPSFEQHHHEKFKDGLMHKYYELKILWQMRKTQLLMPIIFTQGLCLSFAAGNLPKLYKEQPVLIAEMSLCFGILACISSFFSGKIYDRFGIRPLLCFFFILMFLIAFGLLFCMPLEWNIVQWPKISLSSFSLRFIFISLGGLYGALDFLLNSILNITLSSHYSHTLIGHAFSFYRLLSCFSYALCSFLSPFLPHDIWIVIQFIFMIISWTCFEYFMKKEEDKEIHVRFKGMDVGRLSRQSVAIAGLVRPSVLSYQDAIAEEMEFEGESDIEDEDERFPPI